MVSGAGKNCEEEGRIVKPDVFLSHLVRRIPSLLNHPNIEFMTMDKLVLWLRMKDAKSVKKPKFPYINAGKLGVRK